jgi:NitT/TauT family transport system substrate-binding protein
MIAEKSDVVQRFVNAYMQAFADVIKSPVEAADIIIKANPEYAPKKDVLVQQIEADVKHSFFSSETKTHGIGWMTADIWQKTVKTLLEQEVIKQAVDPAATYTNKYLETAKPIKQ